MFLNSDKKVFTWLHKICGRLHLIASRLSKEVYGNMINLLYEILKGLKIAGTF